MLSHNDIGQRVVVRYRLPNSLLTDLLGELRELDDAYLTVFTAQGKIVVSLPDVIAAKVVPPRPPKYSEIAALERAIATDPPPPQSHWLGGWLLRAGAPEATSTTGTPGPAGAPKTTGGGQRTNSVLPLADPGMPPQQAIEFVEDWYTVRGLPAGFTLPLPLAGGLDRWLAEQGWSAEPPTVIMTRSLSSAPDTPPTLLDLDSLPSVVNLAGIGQAYLEVNEAEKATIARCETLGFQRHHRRVHRKMSD